MGRCVGAVLLAGGLVACTTLSTRAPSLPPLGAAIHAVGAASALDRLTAALTALDGVQGVETARGSRPGVAFSFAGFDGAVTLVCVGDDRGSGYWPRITLDGRRAGVSPRAIGRLMRFYAALPVTVNDALAADAAMSWQASEAVGPARDCP